ASGAEEVSFLKKNEVIAVSHPAGSSSGLVAKKEKDSSPSPFWCSHEGGNGRSLLGGQDLRADGRVGGRKSARLSGRSASHHWRQRIGQEHPCQGYFRRVDPRQRRGFDYGRI